MESIKNEDKRIAERIIRIRETFTATRDASVPAQEIAADSFNDFENFVKWEPFNNSDNLVESE